MVPAQGSGGPDGGADGPYGTPGAATHGPAASSGSPIRPFPAANARRTASSGGGFERDSSRAGSASGGIGAPAERSSAGNSLTGMVSAVRSVLVPGKARGGTRTAPMMTNNPVAVTAMAAGIAVTAAAGHGMYEGGRPGAEAGGGDGERGFGGARDAAGAGARGAGGPREDPHIERAREQAELLLSDSPFLQVCVWQLPPPHPLFVHQKPIGCMFPQPKQLCARHLELCLDVL